MLSKLIEFVSPDALESGDGFEDGQRVDDSLFTGLEKDVAHDDAVNKLKARSW